MLGVLGTSVIGADFVSTIVPPTLSSTSRVAGPRTSVPSPPTIGSFDATMSAIMMQVPGGRRPIGPPLQTIDVPPAARRAVP